MEILIITLGLGAIISGFLVISSINPVHSVFSLVLAFVNCSVLLITLGVEFLGLLFLIVYVGAIAILFLFVVMMLNIRLVELLDNATRYVPAGFIIGIIFLLELLLILDEELIKLGYSLEATNFLFYLQSSQEYITTLSQGPYNWINIEIIGNYLYTYGWIYFLVSSLILLVAMIGAIVLTLYHEDAERIKRQDIFSQICVEETPLSGKISN